MNSRAAVAVVCLATCAITPMFAQQDVCLPSANSNEAKTFAALSVPIAFAGSSAPATAHGISIGFELATLPVVDSLTALPRSCRPDKKSENIHPLAGIVRPRLAIAVHGFVIEASWIPPVTVNQVAANFVGLAIGHPFRLASGWYIGLRAEAVFGSLHGPITCDDKAIADPTSECYHGTRSDDEWRPGVYGAEAAIGMGSGNIRPHLGVGYTLLRPRFQVNFTNAQGSTDRRQVNVDLERVALFGGVTIQVKRSSITAEAYATPQDAVTARLVVRTLLLR